MNDPPQRRHGNLSAHDVHRTNKILTLIRAHAQMVQRWLRANNGAEADAVLARLALIDALVMELVKEIDDLQAPVPTEEDGREDTGGER